MKNNASLVEKVLEYWFVLEFLGQDKYPQKELADARNSANALKARLSKGQKGYRSVSAFFEMGPQEALGEALGREARQCGMEKWGNLTVYIGKVKREACIECIAKNLPFRCAAGDRPEKSFDDIACASLQLSPDGAYVEHSLSLSTIVWAMRQVKEGNGNISERLLEPAYASAVEEMEREFFPKRDREESGTATVGMDVFRQIYSYIEKTYLKGNAVQTDGSAPYGLVAGISFQLFANEDIKNKEEDDNYLGLSHDYFSSDLKMALDKVRSGGKDVPDHVTGYISSISGEAKKLPGRERVDLVRPLYVRPRAGLR